MFKVHLLTYMCVYKQIKTTQTTAILNNHKNANKNNKTQHKKGKLIPSCPNTHSAAIKFPLRSCIYNIFHLNRQQEQLQHECVDFKAKSPLVLYNLLSSV